MWAYKFLRKDTRLQVPTFKTFMRQNHDLLKLWFEEEHEPLEERINFILRVFRFLVYIMILIIIEYALINPND